MDLATVRGIEHGRRVRLAVDAMGGDHAPDEVVAGALLYAGGEPRRRGDPRRHPGADRGRRRSRPPGQRDDRGRHPGHRDARAPGAGAPREEGRLDPRRLRPGQARPGRRRDHGRAHRRRDGGRGPAPGPRAAASTAPRSRSRWSPTRARWSCSTSGRTPTRRPRTSPSTPTWAPSSPSAPSGSSGPRVALLSIGEEKGKGDARIQRATELLDASGLNFTGNVEGKDLVHHPADVVVCDAVLGNVTIKFFEGLATFIFDLWAKEFRGSPARAGSPTSSCAPGSGGSAGPSTTRSSAGRRCWASGARSSSPTAGRSGGWSSTRSAVGAAAARARLPGADRRTPSAPRDRGSRDATTPPGGRCRSRRGGARVTRRRWPSAAR